LVSTAYIMAIACGKPNLPLKTNAIALFMYIPALVFVVPTYGTTGAALTYIALNFYYIINFVPLVQAEFTGQSIWHWLSTNLIPFFLAGLVAFGGWQLISFLTSSSAPIAITLIGCTVVYSALAWFLMTDALRASFRVLIKQPKN
jgi:O-antigen/teichoic acid export membrane protein